MTKEEIGRGIMAKFKFLPAAFLGALTFATPALAYNFSIPAGNLNDALNAYSNKTGVQLVVSADAIKGVRSEGATGDLSADDALAHILSGTGFVVHHSAGAAIIVRGARASEEMSDPR